MTVPSKVSQYHVTSLEMGSISNIHLEIIERNVFGTVDSDRWFRQRWIRLWVLAGFTHTITSESKTRHSQSMNNFPLNINSEYSVN
jgi:hypothetical protein